MTPSRPFETTPNSTTARSKRAAVAPVSARRTLVLIANMVSEDDHRTLEGIGPSPIVASESAMAHAEADLTSTGAVRAGVQSQKAMSKNRAKFILSLQCDGGWTLPLTRIVGGISINTHQ